MLDDAIPFYCKAGQCIRQGDVLSWFSHYTVTPKELIENCLKDRVDIMEYPYLVVISQDCDLVQCENISESKYRNAFLPNVLFLPAFPENYVKDGEAYKGLYNVIQKGKNSEGIKKIKSGQDNRYYYLHENMTVKISASIIDFKHYLTIPYEIVKLHYAKTYRATINSVFREDLSRRFATYLSRIGLPVLPDDKTLLG